MQQSGYNDMQLLQQHMMLKQMQEFQRQQQLQQIGEMRQQNSLSHISGIARQGAGSQFLNQINGMPVHDASQMLRGWMQQGASPAAQGMPNKGMFSQDQTHAQAQAQVQALRMMGLASQQSDGSIYGTPVSNVRGNMSQYHNIQGISNESINSFGKASSQAQKSSVQSPGFGNPYTGIVPSDLVAFPALSLELKQGLQVKDTIGQVPIQGLNTGLFSGNLDESNSAQANASVGEFRDKQDQVGWSPVQQTSKQLDSQNSVPLDPMEAKILYNMDGNIWDAFGGRPDSVAGGVGNMMQQPDSSNAVPSIQSGSWSALMQSAVAEASTSDTGMQDEWSGLTFQNTEHSTDNQMSNLMDNENRQTGWIDNNMQSQSASFFTSKSFPLVTDTGISSFPGFQQPGIKLAAEQREDLCMDPSRELTGNYSNQQKLSVEQGQRVQASMHSNNSWTGQMFGHLKRDGHSVASHDGSAESRGNESMGNDHHRMTNGPFVAHNSGEGEHRIYEKQQNYYQRDNTNDSFTSQGFSRQDHGQLEQNKFFGNGFMNVRNVDKIFVSNFQGNSSASEDVPSANDQDANTSDALRRSDFSDSSNVAKASENMLELLHKVDNSKDENSIVQLGSTANYIPIPNAAAVDTHGTSGSQHPTQSSASQGFGLRLAPPSQRLPNSNSILPPHGLATVSNQNGMPTFQSMSSSNEQGTHWDNRSGTSGHAGLLNSISLLPPNLSNAANQLQASTSNFQGNSSASEDVPCTNDHGGNTSASLRSDNSNVAQASENIRELPHGTSGSQHPTQSSASQGFGLRLAPPSQRLPNSSSILPPHGLATVSNQNAMPTFQSMSSSNEQGAHWDNRSGTSGHTGLINSISLLTPNLSNATNQIQTSTSNFQGNSSASEDVPSTNDHGGDTSAALHRSDFSDCSNVAQASDSENMLKLPRDGSQHPTQSSASQGFGLRLAPPSQRLPNSNGILPPHGLTTVSNQNAMPTVQSMSSSNEQGTHWDNRSGTSGHAGLLNSASLLTPNLSSATNQLQASTSNVPVASQPWKPILPGSAGRFPPFGQTPSQDAAQQIYASGSQQFPVLEASAVSQTSNVSSMSQQGEGSPKPQNVWRNVPTHRRSFSSEPTDTIPAKFPSGLSSSGDLSNSTSRTPHGIHNQNSVEAGYKPLEFGASSNSQGLNYVEECQGDEMHHNFASNVLHGQEPISDASVRQSSALEFHRQQDRDSGSLHYKAGAASTESNLGELDHSHGYHKNLAIVQITPALNNSLDAVLEVSQATTLGEQQLHDNSSRFRQPTDGGPNSGSPSLKASLQPEVGVHGHNESQAQSSCGNVPLNLSNHSPVNLHMAPSWFKQYGTLRNGQMVPISDPRFAKTAAAQFSLGRPQTLQSQTPEQLGASDMGQVTKVWPSTATSLVTGQSVPFVLPAEAANQMSLTRPKKRKFEASLSEPWHKEASQSSERLHNISVAEEEWALATNRLIEKVEYDEMIEDLQPRLRSKKRLILTRQLAQLLFSAGPASIYSMDSASSYHILSYFTARLSLGVACSLANCNRNKLSTCTNNDKMNSEKLKLSEETNDKQLSEIVKAFTDRAKKMEQEFYRLEKAASFVELKVDFQELEKYCVINRFAKFHARGQPDTSTSGMPRPIAERYVRALPMPKVLPEDAQCLSL